MLRAGAPAKVNLFLHVLGRRADGYHDLQSLVVFTAFGDEISVEPFDTLKLSVDGPMAQEIASLPESDNLVMRAANLLRQQARRPELGAHIRLTKHIPSGAGLGGGSSDAAVTLKLLNELWSLHFGPELEQWGLTLGTDLPVCLRGTPTLVEGIGELLSPGPSLPADLSIVLAHTGVALATRDVFQRADKHQSKSQYIDHVPNFAKAQALVRFLTLCGNSLEPSAIALQPKIKQLLGDLKSQPACLLARMSGSGAACFGLFASEDKAQDAARALSDRGWWSVATHLRTDR